MAALAVTLAPPAHADRLGQWRPIISEASVRFGVPTNWIERVMRVESAGRTVLDGRPIRSRAGAIGLMQLMPATWSGVRARLDLGVNPDDPRDNILAGTFYLRLMYDRFGYPGLFAGYNAGPGRYGAYLSGRASLPRETAAYVAAVSVPDARAGSSPATSPRTTLFVVRPEPLNQTSEEQFVPLQASLFVMQKSSHDHREAGKFPLLR